MQDLAQEPENTNAGTVIPGEAEPATQPIERSEGGGSSDDTESRARAMGWVSKEEFRGPADNWRDAETFVKKGEEDLPIVRERLRDTTRKLVEFERKQQQLEQSYKTNVERLEKMSTLALNRQREQIEANYEAAQREAVRMADEGRYDQLDRDKRLALQQHDRQANEAYRQPEPQPGRAPQLAPQDETVVNGWVEQNRWFMNDQQLNLEAQAHHVRLGREKPGLSLDENLRETAAYVRQRYPEKFGVTARAQGTSPVEGGTRMAGGGAPRGKGVNDLPPDAKRQGEKFVKEKLFTDLNEYARDFWSQG